MKKNIYRINLRSTSKKAITLYLKFLVILHKKLKIKYSIIHLPTTNKDVALLKSPHVNKKAKEHFEMRTYRTLFIVKSSPKISILKYTFINKPKSVLLKLRF